MPKRPALSLTVAFLLVGCQAMMYGTANDFGKISPGMTKDQVIAALGQPMAFGADADKHEEELVYRRMEHPVSWAPEAYVVLLRDGKVIKYGREEEMGRLNPPLGN